ncbi:MAG: CGNR zinc finger domain-containing protein, partial [Chloroflexota bacterium]
GWLDNATLLTEAERIIFSHQVQQQPEKASLIFEQGMALRQTIHQVFSTIATKRTPNPASLDALNTALQESVRHRRIGLDTKTGHYRWVWDNPNQELGQLLWPITYSAGELLTSNKLERVKLCSGDNCGWLFLDTSRNGRRSWCEMKVCGNRAKAKRHYYRHHSDQ